MPANGKLSPGERLHDPHSDRGCVTVVVSVMSGRLPTPIDTTVPRGGSSTGSCALFGGSAGSGHRTPAKGTKP